MPVTETTDASGHRTITVTGAAAHKFKRSQMTYGQKVATSVRKAPVLGEKVKVPKFNSNIGDIE